ncbi:MAG: hypothetical protein ACR2PZ_17610 [Pseudomonadales bacterium]
MKSKSRTGAVFIAGLTVVVALILLVDRGGLIAWATLIIGVALLAKIWLKPARLDLGFSVGLAVVPVLAWFGTLYYVISTWESGEVVELAINTSSGPHTARLWVLDIEETPLVYYDAEPEAAKSLLAARPLQFTRAGEVSTRIPKARKIDALPEDEANQILEAMATKYGNRNAAADYYYGLLGRSRDRVALVAHLIEE